MKEFCFFVFFKIIFLIIIKNNYSLKNGIKLVEQLYSSLHKRKRFNILYKKNYIQNGALKISSSK